jgi:ribosomal protein S18 acetylase RimI-like enzyme
MSEQNIRPARREDAAILAELVNYAGEGMPLYLWGKMAAPGESAWEVGRKRAARDEGAFSYRNAMMIERDGRASGSLIGYGIGSDPVTIAPDMPAMFVPLQELENLVPDTWYVNVLAVLPAYRNLGLGSELLQLADRTGRSLGKRGMSLIVADSNVGARRLYERFGYAERARRAMVKEGWTHDGEEWALLAKDL